jgi:hypothetical protein
MKKIIIGLMAICSISTFAAEKVTAPSGYCMQLRVEARNIAKDGLDIANYLQLNSDDETCLGRSQYCMQLKIEHQRYSQRGEDVEKYLQLSESDKGCLNGSL